MLLVSRLRLAMARRPWIYWLFVACCAALIWSLLASAQRGLDRERQRWGTTQRVFVATVDLAIGDRVQAEARDYPLAMLPQSAIAVLPDGTLAARSISAGEVIVEAAVGDDPDSGLPHDWVTFAVDRGHTPTLSAYDPVALFGLGERWCDGLVVGLADDVVDIAVPPSCAGAISSQVAAGELVIGRLP